jgi:hypothetical protein
LTESREHCHGFSIARLWLFDWLRCQTRCPYQRLDSIPSLSPVALRIVTPTPDDLPLPVRQGNPVCSIKEKRGLQENAADLIVVSRARIRCSSVSSDPSPHLLFNPCPVLFSESLPDDAGGQDREVAEETTTDDVIVRAVQFEEEGFAHLEGAELLLPAGLPEVNLVESVQMRQEVKPITIRDPDEETHVLS